MSLPEYEDALIQGYEFLENHNQLLHSLQMSRINADHRTYTENTQGIGNEPLQPGEGISQPGDGQLA